MKKVFWVSFVLLFCLGFRTFDDHEPWNLSRDVAADSKLFISYSDGDKTLSNDLPSSDSLSGTETITVAQAIASIMTDYNSIQASYLNLVEITDPDYTTARAATRSIVIYNRGTGGVNGGQADFEFDGDRMVKCEISIANSEYESAKRFISVLTHEIGHCIGLDHAQEATDSIMSYYHSNDVYRLATDDKMGIIFLYPSDPAKAKEDSTFGMSCSRRK